MTSKKIEETITMTMWGEYDSYHEWSPSYSLADKARYLGEFLRDWETTDAEGRKLVLDFARSLIKDNRAFALPVAEQLVANAHLPDIVQFGLAQMASGRFALELLQAMKNSQRTIAAWVDGIREKCTGRDFIETTRDTSLKQLYAKIEGLLAQLPSELGLPDIQFCLNSETIDRESNHRGARRYELVQEGERFLLRSTQDQDPPQEWPGRISACDAGRGLGKLLFDTTCIGYIHRSNGTNRLCVYEDHYHRSTFYSGRIKVEDFALWDFFLAWFCTALGAAENRIITPGAWDWVFRPLDYSPFYINCLTDGEGWTSDFPHEDYPWFTTELQLEPDLLIRCFYRDRGGNPIIAMKTDAPASMTHVSLHLQTFTGKTDNQLCVCNALGDSDRINAALDAFSLAHGKIIR